MKFADNNSQAAQYLRQAVPLMVQHHIPPSPLNYALWYTYVSKRMPALNLQLDKTLQTYGTCPSLLSEKLFHEHLLGKETEESNRVQEQLVAMINDLHVHAGTAARDTADFNNVLESSLESLNKKDDPKERPALENIIHTLSHYTLTMSESTRRFQEKMQAAQAEIDKLKQELEQSRQDASVDALTGLYNRRTFDAQLKQLGEFSINMKNTSLIIVDVDHFKRFNDSYGHQMGDKVLQHVGKLLKIHCPEPMIPVRYGGEEFAVLLPDSSAHKAAAVAELLRSKIQTIRIKKKNGEMISSISASFGVAQMSPEEAPEGLISRADKALYAAKENGRNQVRLAE